VLVVEKFGKQTSIGRIGGACPAQRRKALGRERCLARRKPTPRSRRHPDDGGRRREGENGARVLGTQLFIGFSQRKDTQAATPAWARYGVRRSGFYDRCPLTGTVETEALGFWVNSAAASRGARTGSSSGCWSRLGGAQRRHKERQRSERTRSRLHQPTKIGDGGPHPRGRREPAHAAPSEHESERRPRSLLLTRWVCHGGNSAEARASE